jgi:CheY-like chemotaxis protein
MSKRILVVEDQPDNRQIIRDMLAATDYHITEAENGDAIIVWRFDESRKISVREGLCGGAGRTRTSNQTIISRYSERGLRARNLRRAVAQISLPMPASRRFPAAVVALIDGKRKTHRRGPQAARGDNDDNFHTRAVRQHAGLLHKPRPRENGHAN